jgi:hypothetical protein
MSLVHDHVEHGGWRLVLALPPAVEEHRDKLVRFVIAAADGKIVEPMRRSRHAVTFQTQFAAGATTTINLFVKVIEEPRRMKRLKRVFRGSPGLHVARVTEQLASCS